MPRMSFLAALWMPSVALGVEVNLSDPSVSLSDALSSVGAGGTVVLDSGWSSPSGEVVVITDPVTIQGTGTGVTLPGLVIKLDATDVGRVVLENVTLSAGGSFAYAADSTVDEAQAACNASTPYGRGEGLPGLCVYTGGVDAYDLTLVDSGAAGEGIAVLGGSLFADGVFASSFVSSVPVFVHNGATAEIWAGEFSNLGGGAIIVDAAELTLVDTRFYDNLTNIGRYGFPSGYGRGSDVYVASGTLSIDGGIHSYSGSGKAYQGASIFVAGGPDTYVDIVNASFTGYKSSSDGGAIAVRGGELLLIDAEFTGCSSSFAYGGAISVNADQSEIRFAMVGGSIKSSTAKYWGGGLFAKSGGVYSVASFAVSEVLFEANSSSTAGGAIYVGDVSLPTIRDCSFVANAATQTAAYGGAIYAQATGAASTYNQITMFRNRFCQNTAQGSGGAVYTYPVYGSVELRNNVFFANQANSPGGSHAYDGSSSSSASYIVANNTFERHNASSRTAITIRGATSLDFVNNVVARSGTGLLIAGSTDAMNSTLVARYNAWIDNAVDAQDDNGDTSDWWTAQQGNSNWTNASGTAVTALDYADAVGDAASFVCATNFNLAPSSLGKDVGAAVDDGDATTDDGLDPDGTAIDLGAYGGPGAWPDDDGDLYAQDASGFGDCDDSRSTVFPDATESCDGVDNDCDGTVDDGTSGVTYYRDLDADGYGSSADTTTTCTFPDYVASGGDCDEVDPAISPGADEIVCNGADENCNGATDDAEGTETWYADLDEDGFGDPGSTPTAAPAPTCTAPAAKLAPNALDCDDSDADLNPNAKWYYDEDLDGWAPSGGSTKVSCTIPAGYVDVYHIADCDDGNANVSPEDVEICNEIDDDCDGTVDLDAASGPVWYPDGDDDGYGDPVYTVISCTQPAAYVDVAGDCDDTTSAVSPEAVELVDDIDQDCDGSLACYVDFDGDGFGDGATVVEDSSSCEEANRSSKSTDCDDTDTSVHPGAPEQCDEIDRDCDGAVGGDDVDGDGYAQCEDCDDANAELEGVLWFVDADLDGTAWEGITDAEGTKSCAPPDDGGWSDVREDCDDADDTIHPGAAEGVADGVDQDCDGLELCYVDEDEDGYGSSQTVEATPSCTAAAYVAETGDCNDQNPGIRPGVQENVGDGIDINCDGIESCYGDTDDDGYGDEEVETAVDPGGDVCALGAALAKVGGDCDDGDPSLNPSVDEVVADGLDQNCSGGDLCYVDRDVDGHGNAAGSVEEADGEDCDTDAGFSSVADDCDDDDPSSFPGGAEDIANDGIDQDCDQAEAEAWVVADGGCRTAPGGTVAVALAMVLALGRAGQRPSSSTRP